MYLTGELLPFNVFNESFYTTVALGEVKEHYEDKAFDYFKKNIYRLKQPNKSRYIYRAEKTAKLLGKINLSYQILSPPVKCLAKEIRCLSR